MSPAAKKTEYLAKAKEAEEKAANAKEEADKAEWLRIAAGYHALAAQQDDKPG